MAERFYITTPIYYPNGEPHLGHVYTTLCCDTVARYHRLVGHETFFLTGTDEHGVKMVKTAQAAGIEPRELADRNVAIFENLWKELGITNDDFIRTTSDRHKAGVQEIVRRMIAKDDIYQGSYEGWYDESQEEFVTETEAKANQYKSAISKKPLTRYSEKSYFFRLTKYAPRVLEYIEANPGFVQPDSRRNEVLSKLRAGVNDLSISRASLTWGITMPNDPSHVIYVWIDALSNYITALGYGQKKSEVRSQTSEGENLYQKFWPGLHLIGKEIMWFHTVYWPAMLMSIGEPLPQQVYAHGWWTSEGEKMSKTAGNFVDLEKLRAIIANYSLDALRYYVLRAAPFGSDLDFSTADFNKTFNELANVLGNLLNRLKMIRTYRAGVVPAAGELEQIDRDLIAKIEALPAAIQGAYAKLALQDAVLLPIDLARAANGYIDTTAPWKLEKDPAKAARLDTVLNLSARAVHASLAALLPVMPAKAAAGLRQLNIDPAGKTLDQLLAAPPAAGHKIGEGSPLFPKVV